MNELKLLVLAVFIIPILMISGAFYIAQSAAKPVLRSTTRFFDWAITE